MRHQHGAFPEDTGLGGVDEHGRCRLAVVTPSGIAQRGDASCKDHEAGGFDAIADAGKRGQTRLDGWHEGIGPDLGQHRTAARSRGQGGAAVDAGKACVEEVCRVEKAACGPVLGLAVNIEFAGALADRFQRKPQSGGPSSEILHQRRRAAVARHGADAAAGHDLLQAGEHGGGKEVELVLDEAGPCGVEDLHPPRPLQTAQRREITGMADRFDHRGERGRLALPRLPDGSAELEQGFSGKVSRRRAIVAGMAGKIAGLA